MTTIVRYTDPAYRHAARCVIRFAEGAIDDWTDAYVGGYIDAEAFHQGRDGLLTVIADNLARLASPDCGGCGGWGQRLILSGDANGIDIDADTMPCFCTGVECGPVAL